MTRDEMHTLFRELGQQMGLQNIRGIIPDEIDMLLNAEVSNKVNTIIKENTDNTTDKVTGDNAKVSQINALSTLYKTVELNLCKNKLGVKLFLELLDENVNVGKLTRCIQDMPAHLLIVDFAINYIKSTSGIVPTYVASGYFLKDLNKESGLKNTYEDYPEELIDGETYNTSIATGLDNTFTFEVYDSDSGFLVDKSIEDDESRSAVARTMCCLRPQTNSQTGRYYWGINTRSNESIKYVTIPVRKYVDIDSPTTITNWIPVRIIDDANVAWTLNDSCLKATLASPIITMSNKFDTIDLYIDKFVKKNNKYFLKGDLVPYKLRMSYIAKPAKISSSQDCDLPEFLHVDIVKGAVDLFRKAIGKQSFNNEQNEGYNPYVQR